MSTEKSAIEQLRERQLTDAAALNIEEPEIKNIELSDLFEEVEEQPKKRKIFGKRSDKKEATEIKIKNNVEVRPAKEPVAQVVNRKVEDMNIETGMTEDVQEITADDVAPALLEVQPDILETINHEDVQEEVDEEDPTILYEKKRFLASQYESAESYLEEHSQNGYHFIRKKGKKFYFKEGQPKHYYYQYCYFKFDPEKGDWDKWEKAGWKLVGRASGKTNMEAGWFIFRNELHIGEYKKYIENDMEKFKLFKRLNSSYRSTVFLFFVIMCVCGVTAYLQYQFHGFLATLIACISIFVLSLIFFIIYSRYLWYSRKASQKLKTSLRLKEKDAFIRSQNEPDYSETEDQLNSDWESVENSSRNEEE